MKRQILFSGKKKYHSVCRLLNFPREWKRIRPRPVCASANYDRGLCFSSTIWYPIPLIIRTDMPEQTVLPKISLHNRCSVASDLGLLYLSRPVCLIMAVFIDSKRGNDGSDAEAQTDMVVRCPDTPK